VLLLGIAVIGFCVVLVRIGPALVESAQHLGQQMAGFIFILQLVNLLAFPFVGLLGMVMAGLGLVLGYVGTEPAISTPVFMPAQGQSSQHPSQ
jgi:cytochrome b561